MTWLILGLILFLGAHSVRVVADNWRTQKIEAWGDKALRVFMPWCRCWAFICWWWVMAKQGFRR